MDNKNEQSLKTDPGLEIAIKTLLPPTTFQLLTETEKESTHGLLCALDFILFTDLLQSSNICTFKKYFFSSN